MGPLALGVLAVLAIIGIASAAGAKTSKRLPAGPAAGPRDKSLASWSKYLKELLQRAEKGEASLIELRDGEKKATSLGLTNLASALGYRADLLEAREEIKSESLPTTLKPPWPAVPAKAWSKYVNQSKSARPGFISPQYHLGMFLTGMRLLQDFGIVKNVRKQDYKGRPVWRGDWIPPYSLERYLSDAKLQYEVFVKQAKRDAKAIIKRHKSYLLKNIEGQKATLSGLLAVAKQAGLMGLGKWLRGDRKDSTTRAYKRFNGLF